MCWIFCLTFGLLKPVVHTFRMLFETPRETIDMTPIFYSETKKKYSINMSTFQKVQGGFINSPPSKISNIHFRSIIACHEAGTRGGRVYQKLFAVLHVCLKF